MGRTTKESEKVEQPIRMRLTKQLDERIEYARINGPNVDQDKQQFIIYLLRLGVDKYIKNNPDYFGEKKTEKEHIHDEKGASAKEEKAQ